MAKTVAAPGMVGFDGVRRRRPAEAPPQSLLTRAVSSVFTFVSFAEFEILFVLFFLIAFLIFKDLVRFLSNSSSLAFPEYNDILVKKPGGGSDWWPY